MTVRLYEGDKTETGGAGIEITDNKVVNLILRNLNNLIKINSNNEVYVDLQLDDNLQSSATLPVGVTTGRVVQANGRPVTGTLISAKTTSGDVAKILYGDDGKIRVENGDGTWETLQFSMTAGTGINITNDVISNTGVTSVNGQTGDVTVSASEGNTKMFRLFVTSQLTVGQEIYDWFNSGKNPIIYFISTQSGKSQSYEYYGMGTNQIVFAAHPRKDVTNIRSRYIMQTLTISHSSGTVTSITEGSVVLNVLETNTDYTSPYTPLYNGSPATKKYVDDRVYINSSAPTTPQTGQFWYDTTNSVLKLYDGSNWISI